MSLRVIATLAAVSIGPAAVADAQEQVRRVTLDEALSLFAANNLELRIARAEAREAAGLARQQAAYPNPSALVSTEGLSGGTAGNYRETYFNLSQQIDWPWLAAARGRAAASQGRAAAAAVARDSLRLAFEVRRAFVEAAAAEAISGALEAATVTVRDVERQALERVAAGDLSGYDRRRLRLERLRYERDLSAALVERDASRRRLAALLLPDSVLLLAPAGFPAGEVPAIPLERALALGEGHPALAEARARRDAAASARSAAAAGRLPAPTITGGYKTQSDGAGGVFLSAGLALPLFDRRGAAASAVAARRDAAESRATLVARQVQNEVRRTHDALDAARRHAAFLGEAAAAEADAVLDIARLSYREGEMTLLELLDGVEAYRDGRISLARTAAVLWTTYFDLERAAGAPLSSIAQEAR